MRRLVILVLLLLVSSARADFRLRLPSLTHDETATFQKLTRGSWSFGSGGVSQRVRFTTTTYLFDTQTWVLFGETRQGVEAGAWVQDGQVNVGVFGPFLCEHYRIRKLTRRRGRGVRLKTYFAGCVEPIHEGDTRGHVIRR